MPGCIEYPFPLRADGNVCLWLPRDLSLTEARRLGAFLLTLVDPNKTAEPDGEIVDLRSTAS
jgi:hypothetical protein